ncbi:MAG: hypothetical protein HY791_39280 [Deltaproteobacteria bacterium]|nr:hypothetical protein [Deltaproteobacteria bacterium]
MARINAAPTPEKFAETWTRAYAATVRGASTDGERITRSQGERLIGGTGIQSLFADNVVGYLDSVDQNSVAIDKLVAAGYSHALEAGKAAAGPNNVLSIREAQSLPTNLRDDFLALRGQPVPRGAEKLAARLEQIASGLMYSSESDYPYTKFSTRFPKGEEINATTFRKALDIPENVEVRVRSAASFFSEHKDPEQVGDNDAMAYAALEKAMKATMTSLKFVMVGGEDQVEGQVYVVGRTQSGDLAGLSSTRIWT